MKRKAVRVFEKITNIRLTIQVGVILIFFATFVHYFPGKGLTPGQNALFSVASFLFSIFIGFSLNNQRTRYNNLFDVNRSESSMLYSIYMLSLELPEKDHKQIQKLIDNYLVEQIDYVLADYANTDNSYTALTKYCLGIEAKTEKAKFAKDKIVDLLQPEQEDRYHLQNLLQERISTSEWATLGGLYIVTLYFILSFNVQDPIAFMVICLLSTAASMLMLILFRFDSLTWHTQAKIWQPLERLFLQMDLLPYYPRPALKNGQAKPTPGQAARVADFAHAYPDFRDKKVTIVTF